MQFEFPVVAGYSGILQFFHIRESIASCYPDQTFDFFVFTLDIHHHGAWEVLSFGNRYHYTQCVSIRNCHKIAI